MKGIMHKLNFKFSVQYFKPSGKFYSSGEFTLLATDCGPPGHPTAYMDDAVQWLRGLGRNESLPGLISSKWDGFIVADSDEGHPVLIVPDSVKEATRDRA